MFKVRAVVLLTCGALASGCVIESVAGSGAVVTETRTVAGFSSVSVGGSGQLLLDQSGTESVTVTADDNVLPYVRTEVRDGTLFLGFKDGTYNVRPTRPVIFRVSVRSIDDLHVSGSGKVDATRIDAAALRLSISGSGDIVLHGRAEDLAVSVSGSGRYIGDEMDAVRATVDISGSGRALVAARERLSADVSGSGMVEYLGTPIVRQHVSGSGRVRKR
jgi:hypothetical protein